MREAKELDRADRGHVSRRPGADPDDAMRDERRVGEDALDTRERERSDGARWVAGRGRDRVGARRLRVHAAQCETELVRINAAVARNEREDEPSVAVEHERLDDL